MPQLIRNGTRLFYREAGSGGPPLVFVHGFAGSGDHFSATFEHFKARQRVIALDRRGHGRSDRADGPYAVEAIAEEIAFCIRELGLARPVVVTHSMGVLGFELLRQEPGLAAALIVLDAPILPPQPVRQAFEQLLAGLRTPAYREVIAATCEQLIFLPTDDPARRSQLHAAMLETPHDVLVATWEAFLAYDVEPALAACKLPLLCVNAVMPLDEPRLRALCPQVVIGRTVGAGHFPQLEVPEQVNAMIERFLKLSVPA